MPFYGCAFRSLTPTTDALALAEDQERDESSLRLLSRIVREQACTWFMLNLIPIHDNLKNHMEKLGKEEKLTIESWRLMPHLRLSFSLLIEIAAAADLADEPLNNIKLYDTLLDKVRPVSYPQRSVEIHRWRNSGR